MAMPYFVCLMFTFHIVFINADVHPFSFYHNYIFLCKIILQDTGSNLVWNDLRLKKRYMFPVHDAMFFYYKVSFCCFPSPVLTVPCKRWVCRSTFIGGVLINRLSRGLRYVKMGAQNQAQFVLYTVTLKDQEISDIIATPILRKISFTGIKKTCKQYTKDPILPMSVSMYLSNLNRTNNTKALFSLSNVPKLNIKLCIYAVVNLAKKVS